MRRTTTTRIYSNMAEMDTAIQEYRQTHLFARTTGIPSVEVWRELFAKMSIPKCHYFQKAVIREEIDV
jgi:hypothetical protein